VRDCLHRLVAVEQDQQITQEAQAKLLREFLEPQTRVAVVEEPVVINHREELVAQV
jgi:hypothetical protein